MGNGGSVEWNYTRSGRSATIFTSRNWRIKWFHSFLSPFKLSLRLFLLPHGILSFQNGFNGFSLFLSLSLSFYVVTGTVRWEGFRLERITLLHVIVRFHSFWFIHYYSTSFSPRKRGFYYTFSLVNDSVLWNNSTTPFPKRVN